MRKTKEMGKILARRRREERHHTIREIMRNNPRVVNNQSGP